MMNGNEKKSDAKNKIILFPNLLDKLVEKGLQRLTEMEFSQAAELFEQAIDLDPEHVDANVGLILAFVELGRYSEAKDICNELLRKGLGDYAYIVHLYVLVLQQLNEHEEIITTIEAILDEGILSHAEEDELEKMLQLSKEIQNEGSVEEIPLPYAEEEDTEELFENKSDEEIFDAAAKLTKRNVRPYADQIKRFLADEGGHPFLKTLLINILRDQEYEQTVAVHKFSRTENFIPAQMPEMKEGRFYVETLAALETEIGQDNPVLFEFVKSLLERHHFLFYPLDPSAKNYRSWAAAYHYLAETYQGNEMQIEAVASLYDAELDSVEENYRLIMQAEEISYPLI